MYNNNAIRKAIYMSYVVFDEQKSIARLNAATFGSHTVRIKDMDLRLVEGTPVRPPIRRKETSAAD